MYNFYSIYLIVSSVIIYVFDLVATYIAALHTIISEIRNVFKIFNFFLRV
jgi:hypothetical protein